MLQYKAGYKFVEGGVHAQVLDFPAVISCGADLDDARRMLDFALVDVAETLIGLEEPLPRPDPAVTDAEMDLEEPIFLEAVSKLARSASDGLEQPVACAPG